MDDVTNVIVETQKVYARDNRMKDKIIVLLIVLMFLEAIAGFGSFVWYESQFDVTEEQTVDIDTEGDNANAQYIDGNQYNDSAVHNDEGGGK